MVFTRPQARQAFSHILDSVLEKDDSSPLKQALIAQGIEDMFSLVSIDEDTIDSLVYDRSSTVVNVPVNRADKSMIKAFVHYVRHLQTTRSPLAQDWLNFTQEGFDEFRVSPSYSPLSASVSLATTTAGPASRYTPVETFRRGGIKRCPGAQDFTDVVSPAYVQACDTKDLNLRAELFGGEDDPTSPPASLVQSRFDGYGESKQVTTNVYVLATPVLDPQVLVDRTFYRDRQEDDQKPRAKIARLKEDCDSDIADNSTCIKIVGTADRDSRDIKWKFKHITYYQGPLKSDHLDYKGSTYNGMIEWENGEVTTEPRSIIAADDPITCATYAKRKNLLDTPGWKRFFKSQAKEKNLFRAYTDKEWDTCPHVVMTSELEWDPVIFDQPEWDTAVFDSVYGELEDVMSTDVTLTHYVDLSSLHDATIGRSVTGTDDQGKCHKTSTERGVTNSQQEWIAPIGPPGMGTFLVPQVMKRDSEFRSVSVSSMTESMNTAGLGRLRVRRNIQSLCGIQRFRRFLSRQ
jgi:hypothetical protein